MSVLPLRGSGNMRFPLITVIHRRLAHTVMALYAVQVATYLVPLATIPYVARVLGPGEWGRLAVAQAAGCYVMVLVEFGFGLSATREVARRRSDRRQVAEILSSVLAAKLALTLAAAAILLAIFRFVPLLRDSFLLVFMALLWAVTRAFNLMWFFQGLERVRFAASIEVAGNAAGAAAIFAVVQAPSDAWKVLLCQAAGCLLALGAQLAAAWREFPPQWPRLRSIWDGLVIGASMFVFRSAVSFYTSANVVVVGQLGGALTAGLFAGAEKLCRAGVRLQDPFWQALYPRLCFLRGQDKKRAGVTAKIGTLILVGFGFVSSILLFLASPFLVRILLGAQYFAAVPIVRIMAFLPLTVGIACAIAFQWMLPLGRDREMTWAAVCGGAWSIGVSLALFPLYGPRGVAFATVTAELVVSAYYLIGLRSFRRKANAATRAVAPAIYLKRTTTSMQIEGR